MDSQAIQVLLQQHFADCEVRVAADGNHVGITIVGDVFNGLRAVKRQQMVYAVINDAIASGAIHAVNMQLFTPAEWAASGK